MLYTNCCMTGECAYTYMTSLLTTHVDEVSLCLVACVCEHQVVQRRIDLMTAEGVEFKTNVDVGVTLSAKELMNASDAVVLCMGATWPRDLPIKGRQAEGIYYAMSFLETWQKKQSGNAIDNLKVFAKDKNVIVVGGGDTGVDCIATALRQVRADAQTGARFDDETGAC